MLEFEDATDRPGVRWQALMRHVGVGSGGNKESLANTLRRLAERRLVVVNRPSRTRAAQGRLADMVELTEAGRARGRELRMHGGVTRATAERQLRSQDPLAAVMSYWSKERERLEELVLSDPGLIGTLERLFGPESELGGGSPIEEAAKRFLLVARSRFMQDYVRRELSQAVAVLEEPTPEGKAVVGLKMLWGGGRPFDPNDPLTKLQIDHIAALFGARRRGDD